MDRTVYHFTDTARLPWILQSGELRPGANRIGGFPHPDFLWATTSERGARSAAASMQGFRTGLTRMVRFILHADDFEAWRDMVRQFRPGRRIRFRGWSGSPATSLRSHGAAGLNLYREPVGSRLPPRATPTGCGARSRR